MTKQEELNKLVDKLKNCVHKAEYAEKADKYSRIAFPAWIGVSTTKPHQDIINASLELAAFVANNEGDISFEATKE